MTKPRAAALSIALALIAAGCSAPAATPAPTPPVTAAAPVAAPSTTAAQTPTVTPSASPTAAVVAKAALDALSARCADGKITGTTTEVYDTCFCVGALVTSGGTMAGQMPDGRAVADTCPALIAKAQE